MKYTIEEVVFDDDDPRFVELVAYVRAIRKRGRGSPVPRIIAEWALLGFLMTTGKIAVGGSGAGMPLPAALADVPDPAAVAAAQREAQSLLDDFFG